MRWTWAIVCSVLCAVPKAAVAAGELMGISRLELTIESLDDDNRTCGVTEDVITRALTYPISGSRLRLERVNNFKHPYLYVNITTIFMRSAQNCASSVNVQLRANQTVLIEASRNSVFTKVLLWSQGSIYTSSADRHGRQIQEGLEDVAKKLVTDWNLDNRAR